MVLAEIVGAHSIRPADAGVRRHDALAGADET